jgi:hypothetical protein
LAADEGSGCSILRSALYSICGRLFFLKPVKDLPIRVTCLRQTHPNGPNPACVLPVPFRGAAGTVHAIKMILHSQDRTSIIPDMMLRASTHRRKRLSSVRIQSRINLLLSTLLFSTVALAQTIPATGLCSTGLTPASPLPIGCTTSTPVTPVNPDSGGTSVDGNWQLATPYPSASYTQQAPDVCHLDTFGPAWIDAPDSPITTPNGNGSNWFNPPGDVASQWITPEALNNPGGWYVYRTRFPVPATSGVKEFILTVTGKVLIDDLPGGIFLGHGRSCQWVAMSPFQGEVAADSEWHDFGFAAAVVPGTEPYLYFLTYNINAGAANPTGLRVEFTSATLTPE